MRNFVGIFDAKTDGLVERIWIPSSRKNELYELMAWQEEDDEMYVYDLSPHQLRVIGGWFGRDLTLPSWIVQLVGAAD